MNKTIIAAGVTIRIFKGPVGDPGKLVEPKWVYRPESEVLILMAWPATIIGMGVPWMYEVDLNRDNRATWEKHLSEKDWFKDDVESDFATSCYHLELFVRAHTRHKLSKWFQGDAKY